MRSGSTDRVSQTRKERTAIRECFDHFHCCLVEKMHLDGPKLLLFLFFFFFFSCLHYSGAGFGELTNEIFHGQCAVDENAEALDSQIAGL